ncbi:cytochrome P450 [Hypoxylon trugodes]|uniref:cytochrome P450 n=1 Tax=Hypoxylon trugodes TaxID=326681 RepID=UPI002195DE57|nr:cytochrome P450 [Hypoxylon trugodes]KAI1382907.1 cytochrome P450 [Hypoxylon trugodes]
MPPLPGPRPLPIIGNLLDLDLENTIQSWVDLAKTYGPIYKLRLGGADRIFVTGYELVNEICSRNDFVKVPVGLVRSQKDLTPEGLFTADYGQESWAIAHRTLVPSFGPLPIQNMFSEMHDMISQLVLKWARFGEENPIDVTADFTRLTLDTIGLCAMGMRFNSFYTNELHPFVTAMIATLSESQLRSVRPRWLSWLLWGASYKFDENSRLLHEIAGQVIANRRANPSNRKDLLNAMLNEPDPITGENLSDQIVIDNMITFLIAGHETTSGLLSFLFAFLMSNPEKYRKLREEIDNVLRGGSLTPDHLSKLPYTKACLKESLRLYPVAAGFSLSPIGDKPATLGNEWVIKPSDCCVILLPKLHRDRGIFGSDADEFKPERMLEENFKKLPPNCYKPFGHGSRACIGSDFAMQEAIMATAILVQKFDFRMVDPEWKMAIKQTGTLKPRGLFMYAKLRPSVNILTLQRDLHKIPTYVDFFGSNTGTCKGLAERLAVLAKRRGFICAIRPLDETVQNGLLDTRPIVFVSSTHYDGQPPDNATKFLAWLSSQDGSSLTKVKYAVFGCGNREWQDTYQAIPAFIDNTLEKRGAYRISQRGIADAGEGNILGDFETWLASVFWPAIDSLYGNKASDDSILSCIDSEMASKARVLQIKSLTTDEDRPKFHMEIDLPGGTSYEVGDYLEICPQNPKQHEEKLRQILKANSIDPSIEATCSQYELNRPASSKQVEALIRACRNEQDISSLKAIQESLSKTPPPSHRPSIIQLLTAHPSISFSITQLTAILPPIQPRLYSISSSPLTSPSKCTLTWSLITQNSGDPGLASYYLAALQPGASLSCSVRPGNPRFRPPQDPSTPVVMICAGAGIAPFMGFVAHRVAQIQNNSSVTRAPTVLFVGCRTPQHAPYKTELSRYGQGVVDVRYAYSRTGHNDGQFSGYIQDRVWADREELAALWDAGARVYVCGSRAFSQGVKEVARRIYKKVAVRRCGAKTETEVDEWWVDILKERYAVDVF